MRKFGLFGLVVVSTLAGSAALADGVSVAGVYSTKHKATIDGSTTEVNGFLSIDSDGRMTVYAARRGTTTGKDCYFIPSGNTVNSLLQGRTLVAGTSPSGEPAYQVQLGEDSFGIITQPDAQTGRYRWYFHSGKDDSTATVAGAGHIINSGDNSFSLTVPSLAAFTPTDIHMQRCE